MLKGSRTARIEVFALDQIGKSREPERHFQIIDCLSGSYSALAERQMESGDDTWRQSDGKPADGEGS